MQKPLDQSFQITDVLFSPFDLYPDIAEVGLASHGPEQQNEGSAITTFYLATSALVSQGQRRTVGRAVQRLPRGILLAAGPQSNDLPLEWRLCEQPSQEELRGRTL